MNGECKEPTIPLLSPLIASGINASRSLVKKEMLLQDAEESIASKTKSRSRMMKKRSAAKLNEAIKKLKKKQKNAQNATRKKAVEIVLSQVHSLIFSLPRIFYAGCRRR